MEILATICLRTSVGAGELAAMLVRLTNGGISRKLRVLEMAVLVESGPSFGEPDQTRFSLTHKGVVIARLGEPVFLYLRLAEGWNAPTSPVRPAAQAEAAEKAADVHAEART